MGPNKWTAYDGDVGSSSSGRLKPPPRDYDYEVAARLQEDLNKRGEVEPTVSLSKSIKTQARSKSNISGGDSRFPQDIQDALDEVQSFASEILETTCHKCDTPLMADFSVDTWLHNWQAAQNQKEPSSICATFCTREKCGALTCIGCGHKPRVGKFLAEFDDLVVDWCCQEGRLFATWVLLSKYDVLELNLQSKRSAKTTTNNGQNLRYFATKGAGYGNEYSYRSWKTNRFGNMNSKSPNSEAGWNIPSQTLDFSRADEESDKLTGTILGLVSVLLPHPKDKKKACPPSLGAMIELSLLQDRAAELLRNDSLQDMAKQSWLYFALLDFIERLGKHPDISHLVREKRYIKQRSAGLQSLSASQETKGKQKGTNEPLLTLGMGKEGMGSSLATCMDNLAVQSKNLLRDSQDSIHEFSGDSGQVMLELVKRVVDVHSAISTDARGRLNRGDSAKRTDSWAEYNKKHCISREPNVIDRVDPALRAYNFQSPKNRIKRLVTEASEMSTSLPPNIFVKVDDVRPDVMKCLIVGAEGTPYECGLFEFDISCGPKYPTKPPKCYFCTTGGGRVSFNPNLYPTGKGTWPGTPAQQWQPGKSTILSVLISIQALILCDNPWENEPGRHAKTVLAKTAAKNYHSNLQVYTIRFAMLDWLQKSEMRHGIWKDVGSTYFRMNGAKVVATAQKWARTNKQIQGWCGDLDPTGYSIFGFVKNGKNLLKELQESCPSSSLKTCGGGSGYGQQGPELRVESPKTPGKTPKMREQVQKTANPQLLIEQRADKAQRQSGLHHGASTWQEFNLANCVLRQEGVADQINSDIFHSLYASAGSFPKSRMKHLLAEIADMGTSLPPNIFVRVDDVRQDLMKALIIGPDDTPYQGGLFEFDIWCTSLYPLTPPAISFRTTGNRKVEFSPHLYNDGGICLSLLTTMSGNPPEAWQPNKSTIMSILISIQAFIFCKNPASKNLGPSPLNRHTGGASKDYVDHVQAWTLRFAILDWLQIEERRNGVWKDVLEAYFRCNGRSILAMVERWAGRNKQIGKWDRETQWPCDKLFNFGLRRTTDLLAEARKLLGGKVG